MWRPLAMLVCTAWAVGCVSVHDGSNPPWAAARIGEQCTQLATLPGRASNREAPNEHAIRIMPLGDSITFGVPHCRTGGYRRRLWTLLSTAGPRVTFVGSMTSGAGSIPEPANEGHSGWTIAQLHEGIAANGWLEQYQPDVVLLHIGRNDISHGQAAAAPAHFRDLLGDILARLPQAQVIVAQIVPGRAGPGPEDRAYNTAVASIVAAAGSRVSLVDMQDVLSPGDFADEVHPSLRGYDKMAAAWAPAITAVVSRFDVPSKGMGRRALLGGRPLLERS